MHPSYLAIQRVHFDTGVPSCLCYSYVMVQTLQGKYLKALIALPIAYSLLACGLWISDHYGLVSNMAVPAIILYLLTGSILYYALLFKYTHENIEANRMRKVLHEEQLQSETLIASLTDGIIIINRHGVIQLCNKIALDMFDMKRAEVVGRDYQSVIKNHFISEEVNTTTTHLIEAIGSVISAKKSIVLDALTLRHNEPNSLTVSCGITPITDNDGGMDAVLLTLHDVSNYIELQDLKDDFISTASHELRTPMTVIAGYSDLLLNPMFGELTDKQRHYVSRTKETTKQLISLVNDMLDITKLESGKLENSPQTIPLSDFSENFIANLNEEFAKKNLSIKTDLANVDISVDKNRLNLVYSNLLSNAIKFSEENKSIEFKIVSQPDVVEISVKDNGPGVPKELQKEIFTKFSRTKNTISAEKFGTGLGLAIVSEIIKEWGGIIGVDSDGKNGSRFYFTIPHQTQAVHKENVT